MRTGNQFRIQISRILNRRICNQRHRKIHRVNRKQHQSPMHMTFQIRCLALASTAKWCNARAEPPAKNMHWKCCMTIQNRDVKWICIGRPADAGTSSILPMYMKIHIVANHVYSLLWNGKCTIPFHTNLSSHCQFNYWHWFAHKMKYNNIHKTDDDIQIVFNWSTNILSVLVFVCF